MLQRAVLHDVMDFKSFCEDIRTCTMLRQSLLEPLPLSSKLLLEACLAKLRWSEGQLTTEQLAPIVTTLVHDCPYPSLESLWLHSYVIDLALELRQDVGVAKLLQKFQKMARRYRMARPEYKVGA